MQLFEKDSSTSVEFTPKKGLSNLLFFLQEIFFYIFFSFLCLAFFLISQVKTKLVSIIIQIERNFIHLTSSVIFYKLNKQIDKINKHLPPIIKSSYIQQMDGSHEFHEACHSVTFIVLSQFTPKMKANAVPRLLSSLV